MKRLALVLVLALFSVSSILAQRNITGVITDESGEPLIGASVLAKGTTTGTVTDFDGSFSLNVPEGLNALVISYTGFEAQEITLGASNVVNITLREGVTLSEAVVTALGIEREKKALGYSAQEVKGDVLTTGKDANIINSLAGRIAGVNVTSGSGSVGASSRITIRGNASFSAENQPLFVIDGIPVDNKQPRSPGLTSATVGNSEGADYGNGLTDINADDIESITVLKGPTAAALYGSRAQNGAILVTTKSGKERKGKGLGISYSGSYRVETPLVLPEFQNSFGQGGYGQVNGVDYVGVDESWGHPLDGREMVDYLGNPISWSPRPDNVKDFFETGKLQSNSIAFSGANEHSNFRLSLSDLRQDGVMPNTEYDRQNISFNGGTTIGTKLTVNASANYSIGKGKNRPQTGYSDQNPMQQLFNWFGRQVDTEQLSNYTDADGNPILSPDGTHYNWNSAYHNNPYWILRENVNNDRRDRLIGNIIANYEVAPWISLGLRAGTDYYFDQRKQIYKAGTIHPAELETGGFQEAEYYLRSTNVDFTINLSHQFSEDLNGSLLLGVNRFDRSFRSKSTAVQGLVVPDVYNVANAAGSPVSRERLEENRINGAYFSGQLGFRNYLYLDITGRNDWSSTLPEENRSYFYPSVSTSFVFSELVNLPFLSFGKIRGGWAKVGNDTDPYKLTNVFLTSETSSPGATEGYIHAPYNGVPSFTLENRLANEGLLPEKTNSYEFGLDLKFLRNRLGVDFTYYNSSTTNQIVPLDISDASGFSSKLINAGEVNNKGIELMIYGTPVQVGGFSWDLFANFSKNVSEVVSIHPDVSSLLVGSHRARLELIEGEPWGSIVGTSYQKDENGNTVIGADGMPIGASGTSILGNIEPDFILGFGSEMNFKGLSFGVLFDWRQGGQFFSLTNFFGHYSGVLSETVIDGRRDPIVIEGVTESGEPNTIAVDPEEYWHHSFSSQETAVYDATYIKLRELRLGYNLPAQMLEKLPFSAINISLVGKNLLLMNTKVNHVDPETSIGFSGNFQGFEVNSHPSVKSFGLSLNLTL
ncbi:MAG: SusC/RagA family TonB-linked outer membrane protein [Cyclobacteriaceae bacterium]|nr:MAG: SusC/RagA family TonB-linked outer membrane protein [Cyclobacteriaceae bacterium]